MLIGSRGDACVSSNRPCSNSASSCSRPKWFDRRPLRISCAGSDGSCRAQRRTNPWRIRYEASARNWSGTAGPRTRTGKCVRRTRRSAVYFVNFLKRTEWHQRPASTVVDAQGSTSPLAALEQLRARLWSRHYSYRTECTYVDWVRRFLDYAARQQGVPQPRVAPELVRDYLAHLAVHRQVSASTQNQACCAILSCAGRCWA